MSRRSKTARPRQGTVSATTGCSWVFTTDILFRCAEPKSANGAIVFTRTETKSAVGMKTKVCDCSPAAVHLHIGHNEAIRTGEVKAELRSGSIDATTDVVITCGEHRIRSIGYQHVRVVPTDGLSLAGAMSKWSEWRKWKVRQESGE